MNDGDDTIDWLIERVAAEYPANPGKQFAALAKIAHVAISSRAPEPWSMLFANQCARVWRAVYDDKNPPDLKDSLEPFIVSVSESLEKFGVVGDDAYITFVAGVNNHMRENIEMDFLEANIDAYRSVRDMALCVEASFAFLSDPPPVGFSREAGDMIHGDPFWSAQKCCGCSVN